MVLIGAQTGGAAVNPSYEHVHRFRLEEPQGRYSPGVCECGATCRGDNLFAGDQGLEWGRTRTGERSQRSKNIEAAKKGAEKRWHKEVTG